MKKTLYVHIGTPKTGTTAIQLFCEANQEAFRKKGYDYPILPFKYRYVSLRRNGHFLAGSIWDEEGNRDVEKEKEALKLGYEMLEESFKTYDNVVLSDENLWNRTAYGKFGAWKSLKKFVDSHGWQLKIIVYLRRQDEMAVSWLKQQIQNGWNKYCKLEWETFIKNTKGLMLDYYSFLEKLGKVIGKENIIVRVFERDNFHGGRIEADFLDALGLELTKDYEVSEEKYNLTISCNACEIKRIINELPDHDKETLPFVRKVTEQYVGTNPSEEKSEWFSLEERKKFLEKYKDCNEKIAREFLHREDGRLFSDAMKESPKWQKNNPNMLWDVIRFFGEMNLLQQKEIEALRQENKNRMEEIRELKNADRELKRELKARIRDLEQTALLFRLRRKTRHLLGMDKTEENA